MIRRRVALVAILALLVTIVTAGQALGSAFYNDSESGAPNPMALYFVCGVFCHNTWDIKVGQWAARPAESGFFLLQNVGGFTGQPKNACDFGDSKSVRNVSAHGWVTLHYVGAGDYQWDVFGDSGRPVSGSPFNLVFGQYEDSTEGGYGCY